MSAPSLFEARPAEPRVVDVSDLGDIRSIVVTDRGAKLRCANGTIILSTDQYFEFVRYRKPSLEVQAAAKSVKS